MSERDNGVMYPELRGYAKELQRLVAKMDPVRDRDGLVWLDGMLTGLVDQIRLRVEAADRNSGNAARPNMDEKFAMLERAMTHLNAIIPRNTEGDLDSLERTCADPETDEELGDDTSSVPARKKPGPAGRSGGAAEELPN